jgi:hypothetical protein
MKFSKPKLLFLILVGIASFIGVVVYVNNYLYKTKASSPIYAVPATIPSDCSRAVEPELNAFIKGVPDGATIQFPQNGCYAQNNSIVVASKSNLVINGNGSIFRSSAPNTTVAQTPNMPNWRIDSGTSVTVENMTIEGNYTKARGEFPYGNQFNHGVLVRGGNGVTVRDSAIKNVFGDGVSTARSESVQGNAAAGTPPHNTRFQRLTISKAARHCAGFTEQIGGWVEDSTLSDCHYGAIDMEIDYGDHTNQSGIFYRGQSMKDMHILRNRISGYFLFGIAVEGPTDIGTSRPGDIDTIEVRGNTIGAGDTCWPAVIFSEVDKNRGPISNITVTDNDLTSQGYVMGVFDVNGGSVTNNKAISTKGAGWCGNIDAVRMERSTSVTASNNGPTVVPNLGTAPTTQPTTAPNSTAVPTSPTTGVRTLPSSIPSDCSRNTEADITNFINSVPNGSTIQFPLNGCYKQENRIKIADKSNIVIDGNGSTFKKSSQGPNTAGGSGYNGNWLILRANNVTIKNMTAIGGFETPGPRNLGEASKDPNAVEYNAGFGVYGGDGITITKVKTRNTWGDGVVIANAAYIDNEPEEFSKNVRVTHSDFQKTFRMCFGPTSGTGIWFEDNICRDNWYAGVDAELDLVHHPLADLHINRNTFEGFYHFGILVPVAGVDTRNIEIKGNKLLTPPDNYCFASIYIGAYPDTNPKTFANVVVNDNEIKSKSTAIQMDHINGGSVQGNKFVDYLDAGCSNPNPVKPVILTNSTGVVVANNGADAPSIAPATPTPAPTRAPTQQPTTIQPPVSGVQGQTLWSDGTTGARSGDGSNISAYATGAVPSVVYYLYSGLNNCTTDLRDTQAGPAIPDANGRINVMNGRIVEGTQLRTPGTYDLCFVRGDSSSRTAALKYTLGSGTTNPTTPPTLAPNSTGLSLSLFLHGIGKGGDSANPNAGGNTSPKRVQRNVKIEVFNSQNQLVLTKDSVVGFSPATGNFQGVLDAGTGLTSGIYSVKVKVDQFLKVIVPGIQNISSGRVNVLPQVTLVTGDMNNDNKINALDYNVLIDCYADLTPAANCSDPAKKLMADLTDDGSVNQFDYNLFLRELTNIAGE